MSMNPPAPKRVESVARAQRAIAPYSQVILAVVMIVLGFILGRI